MRKRIFCFVIFSTLAFGSSCYHLNDEEEDLRTVPVTNNPNIIPKSSSMGESIPF